MLMDFFAGMFMLFAKYRTKKCPDLVTISFSKVKKGKIQDYPNDAASC